VVIVPLKDFGEVIEVLMGELIRMLDATFFDSFQATSARGKYRKRFTFTQGSINTAISKY
jgi:hypothetical protein